MIVSFCNQMNEWKSSQTILPRWVLTLPWVTAASGQLLSVRLTNLSWFRFCRFATCLLCLVAVWRSTSVAQVLSRCRGGKSTYCLSLMGSELPRKLLDAILCRVPAWATVWSSLTAFRGGSVNPMSERRVSTWCVMMWGRTMLWLYAVTEQLLPTCVVLLHGNQAAKEIFILPVGTNCCRVENKLVSSW